MKKEVLVHGAMKYRCDKCGRSWWMFLLWGSGSSRLSSVGVGTACGTGME